MNMVISYKTLRKTMGILAIIFPWILIAAGRFGGPIPMKQSLSAYYWTNANVIFVSLLVAFGIFLLSYRGYDLTDNLVTSGAGVAMILVAIFPMYKSGETEYLFLFVSQRATGIIHYIMAGITFTLLAVMSYFQFTKSKGYMTNGKKSRNRAYRVCGIVMFSSIGFMILISAIKPLGSALAPVNPIFWLETVVLWAFGFSWLVKGEAVLKD